MASAVTWTPTCSVSFNLGRPSFIPGVDDIVLIPTGGPDGRLMAVSIKDGTYVNATRNFAGVTSATVSPDGRRIAFVAGARRTCRR